MAATPHSHVSFLVTNPAQDYEESTEILGVYGSLAAATMAAPRLRKAAQYSDHEWDREHRIEEWRGDTMVGRWAHRPDLSKEWVLVEWFGIRVHHSPWPGALEKIGLKP